MIRTVPLEQVDERHLQSLIDNAVREGRDLEYKREIISGNDESRRELLKGVVALANAAGGDLIFGMAEQQGEAASLHGIITTPGDNEIRRLSEIIQSSVEPRLIGVRMHPVNLSGGGYALVVRVPQSWQPPHRTNFKCWTKYFARNSAGAYELTDRVERRVGR
jgi:predicted HTH transcriptional regulator